MPPPFWPSPDFMVIQTREPSPNETKCRTLVPPHFPYFQPLWWHDLAYSSPPINPSIKHRRNHISAKSFCSSFHPQPAFSQSRIPPKSHLASIWSRANASVSYVKQHLTPILKMNRMLMSELR